MKKNRKKLIILLVTILLLTTGCTKTLKDENKKTVTNPETGQSLTKNILCRPENSELVSLYKENGVNTDKLTKCSSYTPSIKASEGIWDNIFIKPLSWLILKLGYLVKNFGLAVILAGFGIRLILYPVTKKSSA